MREAPDKAALAAAHAELAAAFAARRCRCGAPASAVVVGMNLVREAGIVLRREVKDRNLCLRCVGLSIALNGSA